MDFRTKLNQKFVFTTELGVINGIEVMDRIIKAEEYHEALDAINVHDCPNACLRMNSIMASSVIQQKLNIPTIPHFTCRDRSLLGTQADLLGAHALGIENVLLTTGDGPQHGPYKSTGVYDYNSLELMKLVKKLNEGKDVNDGEFKGKTNFLISATATPGTKDLNRELDRMKRKIEAGADFFQTQAVYDVNKAKEFLCEAKALGKPIILGLMPLKGIKMANFANKNIEGIDVPEDILKQLEDGKSGFEIACEFIKEIKSELDGLHIFGMGDVAITNDIIDFALNF